MSIITFFICSFLILMISICIYILRFAVNEKIRHVVCIDIYAIVSLIMLLSMIIYDSG